MIKLNSLPSICRNYSIYTFQHPSEYVSRLGTISFTKRMGTPSIRIRSNGYPVIQIRITGLPSQPYASDAGQGGLDAAVRTNPFLSQCMCRRTPDLFY